MTYVDDREIIIPWKYPWYANMLIAMTVLTGVTLCFTIGFCYYRKWYNAKKVKKYIEIAHNLITLPKQKAHFEKIFMYATTLDNCIEVMKDDIKDIPNDGASTNAYQTTEMFPTNKTLIDDLNEKPNAGFERPVTAIVSEGDVGKSTRREYHNQIDLLRSKEFYLEPDEDEQMENNLSLEQSMQNLILNSSVTVSNKKKKRRAKL